MNNNKLEELIKLTRKNNILLKSIYNKLTNNNSINNDMKEFFINIAANLISDRNFGNMNNNY